MASNYFESGLKTPVLNKNRSKEREFLQEYLLKVIEREKQTEQLSFTLLQSVENMEQKINTMSVYLEKIQMLQNQLFNQPTKQLELERDLYKLQSMGSRFSTVPRLQESLFPYVNHLQPPNKYNDYQTQYDLIQNEYLSNRLSSEQPQAVQESVGRRMEAPFQTERKLAASFEHQNTGSEPNFQVNMQSNLGLTGQSRSQDMMERIRESNTLSAVHPEPFTENMPQKDWSYAIPQDRHSVYPVPQPRKLSQSAVSISTIQNEFYDPQLATRSLYSQSVNNANGIPSGQHNFNDRYGFKNSVTDPHQNFSVNLPVNNYNSVSEQAPSIEVSAMKNESGTAVTTDMSKVEPNPGSINNQTYENYRKDSNYDESSILEQKDVLQEPTDTIPPEQNQNWINDTDVILQNQNEERVATASSHRANGAGTDVYLKESPVKKDNGHEPITSILDVGRNLQDAGGEETAINNNVKTDAVNSTKTGHVDNAEAETSDGEIEAADNVEIEAAADVEPEVADDVEAGVIDVAETELDDIIETKMVNPTVKEIPQRRKSTTSKTGLEDNVKNEAVGGTETEAADRAKAKIVTQVETSHGNRKSSVQTEDQEIKLSPQTASVKIASPAESRKKAKVLKKAKTRRESVLARKSSLLLSEESSESGGSFFDKGLSLTSSAAYKSLIGAAPITPETQKPETTAESESEDDAERALNMAIRKSSTKENVSPKETKLPSKQETVAERKTSLAQSRKPSIYPTPTQKMKLTKASRLALGLDSESDSAPVQSSIKKEIEAESDEFDFFS